ncbi:acVLRF1 family peptidyl-tRNA hydrolase [Jatrophihabitans sp. DSM 45814]
MTAASSEIPAQARRVTIAAGRVSKWIENFADRHGAIATAVGDTQVVLTASDGSRAWLEIPFPPLDLSGGRPLTTLAVHANRPRRIGVLLVRRGGFAAGVFVGRDLVASKVGTAYVQGTTKAGGWSQQRYARRRTNQARAAFGEAADVAVRILLPEAASLQALVLGGDRPACEATLADPRLAPLLDLPRGPWLAVPDPRLKVLQATPDQFLTVQIAIHP